MTEPPQSVQAPFGAMLHYFRVVTPSTMPVWNYCVLFHVASPLPCISVYQCVVRSALSNNPGNSQEGIVINCVNKTLAAQIVEIDISDIEVDFYFGIWNCDRNVKIRSIYCE